MDPLEGRPAESIHVVDQLYLAPPENNLRRQASFDQRLLYTVEIHQVVVHCDNSPLLNLVGVDDYLETAEEEPKAL